MTESTPKPKPHFDVLNNQLEKSDVDANRDIDLHLNETETPVVSEPEEVPVSESNDSPETVLDVPVSEPSTRSEIVGLRETTVDGHRAFDVVRSDDKKEVAATPETPVINNNTESASIFDWIKDETIEVKDEDEATKGKLSLKLREYETRLHLDMSALDELDTLYKIAITKKLLDEGRVNSKDLAIELYNHYGQLNAHRFNGAIFVLADYVYTGGAHLSGGTGLAGGATPESVEPKPVEAPVSNPDKSAAETEAQEKINAELERARGVYASQLKEWKNEIRKRKGLLKRTLADFGIEKQLPEIDEPQELKDAERTYLNAREKKFAHLNNIPENSEAGKILGVPSLEIADKREALLSAIEKEFEALNSSMESSLPPLEQGILVKGLKALRKVSPRQRLVISSALISAGMVGFGGLSLGAAASYGGYRVAKGMVRMGVGGLASEAAGKVFDKTFDGVKRKLRFENKEDNMQEYLSGINAENFQEKEKMLLRAWQRETNAEKRKKLYKLLTMAGAGLGATIESGSLVDSTADAVKETTRGLVDRGESMLSDAKNTASEYVKRFGGASAEPEPPFVYAGGPTGPDGIDPTSPAGGLKGSMFPEVSKDINPNPLIIESEPDSVEEVGETEEPTVAVESEAEVGVESTEEATTETETQPERIVPTAVELSSKGFIEDMHNLKADIIGKYDGTPPAELDEIMKKTPIELAKQFGFYDAEHNAIGMGFKGEHIGLDEKGNVYYEHLDGEKQIMFDAESGEFHKFDGEYTTERFAKSMYPKGVIGDDVTKVKFGEGASSPEALEPFGVKKSDLDFGGDKAISKISLEQADISANESTVSVDESVPSAPALPAEDFGEIEKHIPLDNGKFVDVREVLDKEGVMSKGIMYDGVNLAHEELIGDRKILVLNDAFQDGEKYIEQRSAFNQAFLADVKRDFFGPKPIAESFEGGKIYVTHHVPLADPDQIRILLNGKQIAEGKLVHGVPEIKINPDLKTGWFLEDNAYERAFKHINKLIKAKTFDFTN